MSERRAEEHGGTAVGSSGGDGTRTLEHHPPSLQPVPRPRPKFSKSLTIGGRWGLLRSEASASAPSNGSQSARSTPLSTPIRTTFPTPMPALPNAAGAGTSLPFPGQGHGAQVPGVEQRMQDDMERTVTAGQKRLTRDAREKEMNFHLNNVTNLRRRYDTLKHRVHTRVAKLEVLKEQLAELIAEQDQNEECERSLTSAAILELQITHRQAVEDVETAVHRRRQLEFLRRRTRFDHGVLEAEVENAKKALEAAKEEANAHQLLARAEKNELQVTQSRLQAFRKHMDVTIRDYEAKLERRRIGAEQHSQILELREEMEHKRRTIRDEEKNNGAPVVTNRSKMVTNAFKALRLKQRIAQEENKAGKFQSQYELIKKAIGGANIDEVVERITSQKQTTADLAQMHKIVQREYQHLLVESSNLEMQLSDIRYSGIGHVTKERKLLDDYDKRLKTIQHEVDSEERSVKAMLDISTRMRQAAWNLMRKLRRIPLPSHPVTTANGDMLDTEDVGVVTHDTIWQAVGQCEWKLARLLDSVVSRDYEHVNVMSLLPSDLNIMVKTEADVLKKQAADEAAAGKEEMYAAAEDDSDEEVDRSAVKGVAADLLFVKETLTTRYTDLYKQKTGSERVPDDVMKTIEDKVKGKLAELVKKHKPGAQAQKQEEPQVDPPTDHTQRASTSSTLFRHRRRPSSRHLTARSKSPRQAKSRRRMMLREALADELRHRRVPSGSSHKRRTHSRRDLRTSPRSMRLHKRNTSMHVGHNRDAKPLRRVNTSAPNRRRSLEGHHPFGSSRSRSRRKSPGVRRA